VGYIRQNCKPAVELYNSKKGQETVQKPNTSVIAIQGRSFADILVADRHDMKKNLANTMITHSVTIVDDKGWLRDTALPQ